jgi:monoamine oxidase
MARTPLFFWLGRMVRKAWLTEQRKPTVNRRHTPDEPTLLAKEITRRDFLKGMLGMAGAAAAMSLTPPVIQARTASVLEKSRPENPVVIVGAGLGGLVTAYRLSQKGIPCVVYEASRRAGGRVYTQRGFNSDDMFVELGGELVDTTHEDIITLCRELSVPLEHFEPGDTGLAPAIYYSEGIVHTEAEVVEAFRPLAAELVKDITKCFPDGELQIPTYQQPYQAAWMDRLSLEEYLNAKTDVAPWLIRLIKAAYTGEYGLDPSEQSALNLLLLIGTDTAEAFAMFGESDEAMRIQGGNSRLVEALLKALESKVPIHYMHRLRRLSYRNGELRLSFRTPSKTSVMQAEQVVLALPFAVLRALDGLNDLGLSPVKLKSIREWGYGTNSKQMIGFKSRFWRQANPSAIPVNTGEHFTDLPSQCFWETSRLQAGQTGIITNFLGGKAGRDADSHQWQHALNDLDRLYGFVPEQFDNNKVFFNWSKNPWAKGSYTCPQPGQYTTLMGAAGEPELEGRLLFAGEHCSVDWAGFMNGAVQSGNMAAQQVEVRRLGMATAPLALV